MQRMPAPQSRFTFLNLFSLWKTHIFLSYNQMQTRDATNKVEIVPLVLCRLCAPFSVATALLGPLDCSVLMITRIDARLLLLIACCGSEQRVPFILLLFFSLGVFWLLYLWSILWPATHTRRCRIAPSQICRDDLFLSNRRPENCSYIVKFCVQQGAKEAKVNRRNAKNETIDIDCVFGSWMFRRKTSRAFNVRPKKNVKYAFNCLQLNCEMPFASPEH